MKTKLTLNVDHKIIERAKKVSARRKVSLSALVEDYLDRIAKKDLNKKNEESTEPTFLERIRKYTHPIDIPDEKIAKLKEEHMREKYGL